MPWIKICFIFSCDPRNCCDSGSICTSSLRLYRASGTSELTFVSRPKYSPKFSFWIGWDILRQFLSQSRKPIVNCASLQIFPALDAFASSIFDWLILSSAVVGPLDENIPALLKKFLLQGHVYSVWRFCTVFLTLAEKCDQYLDTSPSSTFLSSLSFYLLLSFKGVLQCSLHLGRILTWPFYAWDVDWSSK